MQEKSKSRRVSFAFIISKRRSGLSLDDFPASLRAIIHPPPVSKDKEESFLKTLPSGLCDPSYVLSIPDRTVASSIIDFVSEHELQLDTLRLDVALTTHSSMDGVELPEYLIEFVAKTNCRVAFSFICLFGD